MVLVIIDGLRYTEGLGHPTRAYVPEMDALAADGTIIEPFTNDGYTAGARTAVETECYLIPADLLVKTAAQLARSPLRVC